MKLLRDYHGIRLEPGDWLNRQMVDFFVNALFFGDVVHQEQAFDARVNTAHLDHPCARPHRPHVAH